MNLAYSKRFRHTPVDNKSYFSRGQIHRGLVKSLPRSLNRRRMAASMALGDYRYILDRRPPVGRRPKCKKWKKKYLCGIEFIMDIYKTSSATSDHKE